MIMKAEYFLFVFLLFPAGKANSFTACGEVENKKVVLKPNLPGKCRLFSFFIEGENREILKIVIITIYSQKIIR